MQYPIADGTINCDQRIESLNLTTPCEHFEYYCSTVNSTGKVVAFAHCSHPKYSSITFITLPFKVNCDEVKQKPATTYLYA